MTLLLQVATQTTFEGWEIAKGVMLTLTTAGVVWTARTVFGLRDDLRDLKITVIGSDGTNGIASKVKRNTARLDAIEARNLAIDAVVELERKQYEGPNQRRTVRRLRDHLLPEPQDHEEGL